MKIVSVFGGSAPKPASEPYVEAVAMGRFLAEAGYTVATGGYTGVMEGASRGAAEAGGHVIGVTCGLIENWREGFCANTWVKEEIKFDTLRDRLYHLVSFCDAAVALGGGIGTLSEVSLMWSLIQTGELSRRPLVLVGPVWRDTFRSFLARANGYVPERDRKLLLFAEKVDEVVTILSTHKHE
ncbi:MAG TPA: LOG family protein [Anaerolineales bacterium]|nr:LOG family protein [Anaerolineales bacterium]